MEAYFLLIMAFAVPVSAGWYTVNHLPTRVDFPGGELAATLHYWNLIIRQFMKHLGIAIAIMIVFLWLMIAFMAN